jgi:3-oxoacyl-[acyl-carrier protein] reductase
MANSGSLVAKVALVTGGSRGIGGAIVRRLAEEGVTVAFTYFSSPENAESLLATIETTGGRALAIKADSAGVEAVRKVVELAVESFGKLDILVNSAGILLRGTIDAFTVEDFDRMVAVNVRGAFVASQAAARHMVASGNLNTLSQIGQAETAAGDFCKPFNQERMNELTARIRTRLNAK